MNAALVQAWSHVLGEGRVADGDLDLAACALLVAELERPGLDAAGYLGQLDRMAAGARAARRSGESLRDALARHLFEDLGFRGNADDYYDPRNSFLDQVIDRRTGIPITLSVVFLEVGWRLGLDVHGIGFPGHFLVRAGEVILDPFHGGMTLDRAALEERLRQALGPHAQLAAQHLPVASKRQILQRILNNLLGIWRRRSDAAREADVIELMARLAPATAAPGPRRDSN